MPVITKSPVMKVLLLTSIIVVFILGIHIANGAFADPGTDSDPIVARSYVDEKINMLQQQINALAQGSGSTGNGDNARQYTILEGLSAGQTVLTGENTEIILRVGACKAVGGTFGRLADLTSDTQGDLLDNMAIPLNHLVYSARNDGRGVIVEKDGTVIVVRGTYTIVN